jgi:hypothetical protein
MPIAVCVHLHCMFQLVTCGWQVLQLEELKTRSPIDEVLFKPDGKITIVTDGPVFTESDGEWR